MTTKLRREMDNAMVLRGFAPRTREAYLACVTALAEHYGRSPDGLDSAQIQSYLLHLIGEKKLAYASVNQAVCAFRFLFDAVLGHKRLALEIPMAKVPKRLPQILSREEVSRRLAAAASLRARTVLMTSYAAGLRVSELCALQVADIESAPDRMCLKVRQGKGGQDRYTLLSPRLLETLRRYWCDRRPRRSGRRATSITPAVIGIVPSARPGRRRRGSQRAGARCCRCPTFTWCSPCPMPSMASSLATLGRSMSGCSRPSRARSVSSRPTRAGWAGSRLSRWCCIPGSRISAAMCTCMPWWRVAGGGRRAHRGRGLDRLQARLPVPGAGALDGVSRQVRRRA